MSVTVTSTTDSDKAVAEAQAGLAKESAEDNKSEKDAEASDETPDESETSEAEEKESESEDETDSDSEEKPEEPKKKKNGFKKRLARSQKAKADAEQAKADAERDRDYWKTQALKGQSNQETKNDAAKETPKAAGRPNADDYESHADYVEAVADWKSDAKFAERDQKVAQEKSNADFAETLKNHDARVQSFKESHSDYDEVLNESQFKFSPFIQKLILQSDIGPALIYEILTDDDLASKMGKMSPEFQARELSRLEYRLEKNSSDENEPQESETKTEKSKAPPPIRSLKSNSASASKDPDKMSFQEYKKWHAEKFGRR